jgi:hypothetical protein
MGLFAEILELVSADCATNYLRDFPEIRDSSHYLTAYMNGISFNGNVESEDDLIINSYPIYSCQSSLSIRTDAY